MAYYFNQGRVFTSASNWRPRYGDAITTAPAAGVVSDHLRPLSLYVESEHEISNGHIVEWTGNPKFFDERGQRIDSFSSDKGFQYALSSVIPTSTHSQAVAGIVLNKAAAPTDRTFSHVGAAHSVHTLPDDVGHIYRIGRDIALAWVVDSHQNELEGLYTKYVNGVEDTSGKYQLTMCGRDVFKIEPTVTSMIDTQVAELTARFNTLVQN